VAATETMGCGGRKCECKGAVCKRGTDLRKNELGVNERTRVKGRGEMETKEREEKRENKNNRVYKQYTVRRQKLVFD